MRKTYYQDSEEIYDNVFMHINYMNNAIILLDKIGHEFLENPNDSVDAVSHGMAETLIKLGFLIDDDYNEKEIVQLRRSNELFNSTMYQLIINPTLDCNLSCWYCYEKKYKSSKISHDIIEGIKKHLIWKLQNEPFTTLKLSFFGGEPFYNYPAIKELLEFSKKVCNEHKKNLYLDFTTNGTLLTKDIVNFLSRFSCQFQITIDGDKAKHNRIKFMEGRQTDTFSLSFDNMKMIQSTIPHALLFLRINFDANTLRGFNEILQRIKELDNKKTIVILKRVWQVNDKKINDEEVNSTIEKLNDAGFRVDYYTQGKLCFAERRNEAVINYDGNVFKCTTISDFNDKSAYGKLNIDTGQIIWNESKLAQDNATQTPDKCLKCPQYPACYGPCPLQIRAGNTGCYMDTLNLTRKEYFKYLLNEYMSNSNL